MLKQAEAPFIAALASRGHYRGSTGRRKTRRQLAETSRELNESIF